MTEQTLDVASAWRRAYARQAVSDFEVYELLCRSAGVHDCQRMHYLQMALEKSAKAHFWGTSGAGARASSVNRSHKVAEKFLPLVVANYWATVSPRKPMPGNTKRAIRRFCREVDLLAPAVLDGESRRDNCEYPWEVEDDQGNVVNVLSPLDHEFNPSTLLVRDPGMVTFLKTLRAIVTQISRSS